MKVLIQLLLAILYLWFGFGSFIEHNRYGCIGPVGALPKPKLPDVVEDILDGEPSLNVHVNSKGEFDVTTGPSKEEIAVYVCLGLAVVMISVCVFFCCKHCCYPSTRGPTTIIYRHMTIPLPTHLNVFTRPGTSSGCGTLPLIPEGTESAPETRSHTPSSPISIPNSNESENVMIAPFPTLQELFRRDNRDPPPPYCNTTSPL